MDYQKDILRTIVFHDVFDFPMTGEEVFLQIQGSGFRVQGSGNISLVNVIDTLNFLVGEGTLEKEEAFYCLEGRKDLVRKRKIRYPISLRKLARAKRWIRIFTHLPFIKKVFVAGTAADQNAKHDSDIDLVVETGKGRMWTARFFLNALLTVLNMRPRPGRTRDTFCTSFFYDETFEPDSVMPDDLVFQRWIRGRTHVSCIMYHVLRIKKIFEFIARVFPEGLYQWVQIHVLMPKMLREANGRDGQMDVYFDNRVAKFHSNNRRKEFNAEFQKKFAQHHLTF